MFRWEVNDNIGGMVGILCVHLSVELCSKKQNKKTRPEGGAPAHVNAQGQIERGARDKTTWKLKKKKKVYCSSSSMLGYLLTPRTFCDTAVYGKETEKIVSSVPAEFYHPIERIFSAYFLI